MRKITPRLECDRGILDKGDLQDYIQVYEYDFRELRDIAGVFEYVKLDPKEIEGFDTYADTNENVFDWILYLKDNNRPIGNITADRFDESLNSMELAFNLHPQYWGQGYIKEAVVVIMGFLFQMGYDNIICSYSEGNKKSQRVIEKIGFRPYKKEENAWVKNGYPITDYSCIFSRDDYQRLYGNTNLVNNA